MNYDHQAAAIKAMEEKATQANADYAGRAQSQGIIGGLSPREESTVERLQRKLNRIEQDNNKTARALNILQQHPEFEDFLWLLRSDIL